MESKKGKSRNNRKKIKIGRQMILFLFLLLFLTMLGVKIVPVWVMAKEETAKAKAAMQESERVVWVETTELDGSKKQVPVPKGFSASQVEGEMTVNGGFVIYEGDIDWDTILLRNEAVSAVAEASEQTLKNKSEETTNQPKSSANKKNLPQVKENKIEETIKQEESEENKEVTNTESLDVENSNTLSSNTTMTNTEMTNMEVTNTEMTNTQNTNIENINTEVNNIESTNTIENEIETKENQIEENTQTNEITTTQENNEIQNTTNKKETEEIQENKEQEKTSNNMLQTKQKVEKELTVTNEEKTTCTQQEINIFNLQKSVDQYVWVPVDDVTRLYGVDANGKLWGKSYEYDEEYDEDYTTIIEAKRIPYGWEEQNGIFISGFCKEPYSLATDISLAQYSPSQTEYEFLSKEMEQNFCKMIESIEKYGGFYIGRYEAGRVDSSEKSQMIVRKMNTNLIFNDWNDSYLACKGLSKNNDNITTSLISGTLWDETLEWLQKSGAKTYNEILNDTNSWGNYGSEVVFNYIKADATEPIETEQSGSNIIPSGSSSHTKANNIYDLAGNVSEWNLGIINNKDDDYYHETYDVVRGGAFYDGTNPVYRYKQYYYTGLRTMLYIK